MEVEVRDHQTKERSRSRWTPPLDKIFADLVVEQIQLGNRPNNIFDKKTWGFIRDEFNKKTALNFNTNQLRKHLDVLRTRYNQLKSAQVQNNFIMEDPGYIGIDLWEGIEVNPRPEPVKNKDCPIYEQLCIIFADEGAVGRYAQSSHYEELDHKLNGHNGAASGLASVNETEQMTNEISPSVRSTECDVSFSEQRSKNHSENKRTHSSEAGQGGQQQREQEILNSMAKAMLDMIAASKLRSFPETPFNENFSITNCIKALDEIQGLEESLYFAALDLFDDPKLRETFISLTSTDKRLQWLQGKCGIPTSY